MEAVSRLTASVAITDVPSEIIAAFDLAIRTVKERADLRGESVAWDLLEVEIREDEVRTWGDTQVDRYLVLSAPGAKK